MACTPKKVGFLSWRASQLPNLSVLLDAEPRYIASTGFCDLDAMAGWGRGLKARLAKRMAAYRRLPFLTLEDGFLRSVERNEPPLSLVQDDTGIYYESTQPSRLEQLIARPLSNAEFSRARALIDAWRQGRVSKYNFAREYDGDLPERYVLVVDQAYRDRSVSCGGADDTAFTHMLSAAVAENPDSTILIKTHPDFFLRRRRGYLTEPSVWKNPRVRLIRENCHPVRLIQNCERVYTVTSQIGFEALIWGKEVCCFGMPFYAGWGLTQDEQPQPARRQSASLEQLVHAALVEYCRYVDPESGQSCDVERLLEHLALQRRMRERLPKKLHAVGFSRWKQPILRRFTAGAGVVFHKTAKTVPPGAHVLVWGKRDIADADAYSSIHRVEDGFLRSVGLGAELTPPLSWVFDDIGIYYDATQESRLARILSRFDGDKALLERARALRAGIVAAQLSKYNTQHKEWRRPDAASSVILVPGQVENDASLRFGAAQIATNLKLLEAVRRARPDSYIVYKPHPDVAAGLRHGGEASECVTACCDEVAWDAGLPQILGQVDEVHTMTSLAGFEALFRNVPVTCYGQPFYAGWGLTTDVVPVLRQRRLNLNQLTAATLILYPVYISRVTGHYTTPERVVEELVAWRDRSSLAVPLWRRAYRLAMRLRIGRRIFHSSVSGLPPRGHTVEPEIERSQ